jgi:tripartite-type tricarboxylate transporter receptor subunit TctC
MTLELTRRQALMVGAGALGAGLLPAGRAQAAGWPDRPITMAMSAPAGGATDRGIRPIAAKIKPLLGAPAISLQDMSGAGGVQAADYVMSQPADGYTWCGMNDTIEAFPSLDRYDFSYRDFDFWMGAGTACGFTVLAESKIKTFDEFIDWVGSNPGKLSCSSTPTGSLWSNVAVYVRDKGNLGLDYKIANYKGGGPSVRAVLAGEVNFGCMGVTPMANFMRAGKLRCLTATTPEDWETVGTLIPSITRWVKDPLMTKTLPWTNIHGIAVRKEVPEEIKQKIDVAFGKVMADKSMIKIWNDNAFFPFKANRDTANDLMKQRTELQAYVIEGILGMHKKTRDELGFGKIEETL